ncbi:MAG: hypothetical protein Q7R48_01650 [bacterium]|nr:hypothetical protein [bacterium]
MKHFVLVSLLGVSLFVLFGAGEAHAYGQITVLSPNGGELWKRGETYTISWTTSPGLTSVNVVLDCEGVIRPITSSTYFSTGTASAYSWYIDPNVFNPYSGCRIKASNASTLEGADASDAPFTITSSDAEIPVLQITSPTAGQNIAGGTPVSIQWTATPSPRVGKYGLWYKSAGQNWAKIADVANVSATSLSWTPSSTLGTVTLYVGYDRGDEMTFESSTQLDFTIVTPGSGISTSPIPQITITSPSVNDVTMGGSVIRVNWAGSPMPTTGKYGIWYQYSGKDWIKITEVPVTAATSLLWTVPTTSGTVTLYIGYDRGDEGVFESSATTVLKLTDNNPLTSPIPSIGIVTPTSSQQIQAGSVVQVQWTGSPAPTTGKYGLWYKASSGDWVNVHDIYVQAGSANSIWQTGWQVPSSLQGAVTVYVGYDRGDAGAFESNGSVSVTVSGSGGGTGGDTGTIVIPTLAITYPVSGQSVYTGSSVGVTWTATPKPTVGKFGLWYMMSSGAWTKIQDVFLGATSATWQVPNTPGSATLYFGYDKGDAGSFEASNQVNLVIQ